MTRTVPRRSLRQTLWQTPSRSRTRRDSNLSTVDDPGEKMFLEFLQSSRLWSTTTKPPYFNTLNASVRRPGIKTTGHQSACITAFQSNKLVIIRRPAPWNLHTANQRSVSVQRTNYPSVKKSRDSLLFVQRQRADGACRVPSVLRCPR